MSMTFGNFIVVERDSDLKVLRRGVSYDYTMSGNWIFEPGAFVPVIKVGYRCIGIAKVESVLMTETTTTIQFLCAESATQDDRYNAYYDLFKLMLVNVDDSELADMDVGDPLHPGSGAAVFRNSNPKKKPDSRTGMHGRRKIDYGSLFDTERY